MLLTGPAHAMLSTFFSDTFCTWFSLVIYAGARTFVAGLLTVFLPKGCLIRTAQICGELIDIRTSLAADTCALTSLASTLVWLKPVILLRDC